MSVSGVEIVGLDHILGVLARIKNMGREAEEPTRSLLRLMRDRLRQYPPPPPASRYQRTYALQSSWQETVFLDAAGARGVVESVGVPYGRYVQDEASQAWMHQGRGWPTTQSVAAEADQEAAAVIYEHWMQSILGL